MLCLMLLISGCQKNSKEIEENSESVPSIAPIEEESVGQAEGQQDTDVVDSIEQSNKEVNNDDENNFNDDYNDNDNNDNGNNDKSNINNSNSTTNENINVNDIVDSKAQLAQSVEEKNSDNNKVTENKSAQGQEDNTENSMTSAEWRKKFEEETRYEGYTITTYELDSNACIVFLETPESAADSMSLNGDLWACYRGESMLLEQDGQYQRGEMGTVMFKNQTWFRYNGVNSRYATTSLVTLTEEKAWSYLHFPGTIDVTDGTVISGNKVTVKKEIYDRVEETQITVLEKKDLSVYKNGKDVLTIIEGYYKEETVPYCYEYMKDENGFIYIGTTLDYEEGVMFTYEIYQIKDMELNRVYYGETSYGALATYSESKTVQEIRDHMLYSDNDLQSATVYMLNYDEERNVIEGQPVTSDNQAESIVRNYELGYDVIVILLETDKIADIYTTALLETNVKERLLRLWLDETGKVIWICEMMNQ